MNSGSPARKYRKSEGDHTDGLIKNVGQLDASLIDAYIGRFYGYGSWTAPIWFIGMEEGGCPTLDHFNLRLRTWQSRGCRDLEDCPSYHEALGMSTLFGRKAKLQNTWEKLIRIFLGYQGLPSDIESVRVFQGLHFGSIDCGFASLELFPLPAVSSSTWIYNNVETVPYLINRQVYRYYTYPKRAEELRKRIATHKPQVVVIYGKEYRHEWEGVVGTKFALSEISEAVEARFETSRLVIVPHPASRGHRQSYWVEIGQQLGKPNQAPPPTAAAITRSGSHEERRP